METGITIIAKRSAFSDWLKNEEKSEGTIEKYLRDTGAFAAWLNERELTKETAAAWKEYLASKQYAPVTVNSMLAAVNTYCTFAELNVHIRFLSGNSTVYLSTVSRRRQHKND